MFRVGDVRGGGEIGRKKWRLQLFPRPGVDFVVGSLAAPVQHVKTSPWSR